MDRNNFAPRLGVAYSWDSKTVIRAGAGVYYGRNIATNFQYPGPAFYINCRTSTTLTIITRPSLRPWTIPFPWEYRLLKETSTGSWPSGDSTTTAI